MGQLVTTFVGGVVGFLIGGPAGAAIGMSIGGAVGATLFGPTIKGPRLSDLKVTSSTYGIAIPEIYGTVRIGGNLIWTTGIKETKKTTRAGKGGPKVTTYSYDATFAVGLCKGPINTVLRVWADSKLIYDVSNNSSRQPLAAGTTNITGPLLVRVAANKRQKKKSLRLRIYKGTEDQLPDSLIEADKGVGNVSAHRGIAYVVFERMQLEDFGNRIPQLTFEISKSPNEAFPSILVKEGPAGPAPTTLNHVWFPDWDNGRLFTGRVGSFPGSAYELASMRNMQANPIQFWSPIGFGFAPQANLMLKAQGLSNSAPIDLYDLSTGARVNTIGVSSRSLDGFYVASGPRQGELHIPPAFGNQIAMIASGTIIVNVGGVGAVTWVLTTGGSPVALYNAPYVPQHLFPALGSVWGWRNGNNGLQIGDFIRGAGGFDVSPPDSSGNVFWTAGNGGLAYSATLRPFSPEVYASRVTLFDESDGHIFSIGISGSGSSATTVTFKYNPLTGQYKFIRRHPGLRVPDGSMPFSRLNGGTFGWITPAPNTATAGQLNQIDLQNGDLLRTVNIGGLFGAQAFIRAEMYWDDSSASLLLTTEAGFRRVFFNNTVAAIRLSNVVQDIATKSGVLTAEDIDVAGLVDQEIIGFSIDRQSSVRDALKLLATGHVFDGYESDYKLKFRSRGTSESVVTITKDWLARPEEEALKETITQELEMPLKVTVNYYDTSRDHQQGSQSAKRNAGPFPTMWTSKEDVVDLPIVWTPDMAKRAADKLLKMAWTNRTGLEFTLPWRFLRYDPTDIATIITDNATYYTRLTDVQIGQDFSIRGSSVTDKPAAYFSSKLGAIGRSPEQEITGGSPTFPVVMNTPLLRDEDFDTSGQSVCYITAGTNSFTFEGATIFVDDGIEPRSLGDVDSETVMGTVINALPYTTAYESTDNRTVLRVILTNPEDELESVTQLDMLNFDVNAALVGDEVIQFREAVQQPNGEWWLRGLRRARRGTNYALKTHQPGERFVLLSPQSVVFFERPPESYVTTRLFRSVSPGQEFEEGQEVSADLQPRDLMPYTPEDIRITDDGVEVTITVQRRSRVTAPLRDGISNIHFKEGNKQTARIACSVWPGRGLEAVNTGLAPSLVESVPIFDASGEDLPLDIKFPLSLLAGQDRFLARISEIGVVDGIPKWIEFERIGEDRWNRTDFY